MEGEEKTQQEPLQDKNVNVDSDKIIKIRKDKILAYLKKNYNLIIYILLASIVFLAVKIRTRNLHGLKDITTGTWTLGPDLDPFLFLRWSEYIVEHGKLMTLDTMRYVPLGFNTKEELILHPYIMAWFHKGLSLFGLTDSITYSAIIYPVFFFALTVIAFFLLTRKIFLEEQGKKIANTIALIASILLVVTPVFLQRNIAGIPEKESIAFLFFFLTLYFFICAWKTERDFHRYLFAVLSGITTAAMALVWGGYGFIFLTLIPALFISFLFGNFTKKRFFVQLIWIATSFAIMIPFSDRYNLTNLVSSVTIGSSVAILCIVLVDYLLFETKIKNYTIKDKKIPLPRKVVSIIVAIILLSVAATIFFGPSFFHTELRNILNNLIKPATSRLIQTVAENRQPYFTEWSSNLGPFIKNIPIMFWLFFIGSISFFNYTIRTLEKKDRVILGTSFFIFVSSLIFSRYSEKSSLNGENNFSLIFYFLGFSIFVVTMIYYYFSYDKKEKKDELKKINFEYIALLSLFIIGIISARGAIRLIIILVPSVSIIVSFFAVHLFNKRKGARSLRLFFAFLVLLALIFTVASFYKEINAAASVYIPSVYTYQWQNSMSWVRENTPQDAVFAHWWDYGYWLQSIGKRATVLDGGNAIGYWNHLMGRHALTSSNLKDSLEFLYAHNTTHFLIDSTDIGKYGAFSFIGSDLSLDRRSYIPTLLRDKNKVQEKKNSIVFLYPGTFGLDEDIIYEYNGTRIILPKDNSAIAAILIERNSSADIIEPPIALFIHGNQQYLLPLRYVYDSKLIDFKKGIEAGVYIFPNIIQTGQQFQIDKAGALMYLSRRVVNTQLARLYLYKEENPYFKLVHSEDDLLVKQIKQQLGAPFNDDIVYYGGIRGPIRIWSVNYPEDIELKEEYLRTNYPDDLL